MTSPALRYHRLLLAILLFCALLYGSAGAQTIRFADGLVYNDFYAVRVNGSDGESFTLFDVAAFAGDGAPLPQPDGDYGESPGATPGDEMSYFLWVRRVGATGALTYPLSFRKIKEIKFTGGYGGTQSDPLQEGLLDVDGEEEQVSYRRDGQRFAGWFGKQEPAVPFYTSAQLTLTDDSKQSVLIKSDGFLGGIDEDFGTYAMLWLRHDGVESLEFLHDGVYARCPECGALFFDERSEICPFDGETLISAR